MPIPPTSAAPTPPDPLPQLVLTAADLDLVELWDLTGGSGALELAALATGSASHVELLDVENTPLARAGLAGRDQHGVDGWVEVELERLRPLAPVAGALGEHRLRPDGGAPDRPAVLVHRMPTSQELDDVRARLHAGHVDAEPLWLVLAPRGAGPDPVARAALRGLLASRAAGRIDGDVAVLPAWRAGHGVLRPVGDWAEPRSVAAHLGLDVVVVIGDGHDDGPRDATRTALGAAYPAEALPELAPTSGQGRGAVVLLTGLSGSGKSTVANALAARLAEEDGHEVTLLDGDEVRQMLSAGLGFDRASRELNVSRIGYVASLVARHGGVAVAAPIAPFAATRAQVRRMAEAVGVFLLVHVSTPLEVCEARDRKGLYAKARAGEIAEFTGISSPYEPPQDADVVVDTSHLPVEDAVEQVRAALRAKFQRAS